MSPWLLGNRPMHRSLFRHAPLGALIFLGLLCPSAAQACLHRKFSIDEMTRGAAKIIEGRVASVTCAWNADQSQIFTHVTIDVQAYYKGGEAPVAKATGLAAATTKLELKQLGGQVDDVGLLIIEAPDFAVNQDVFLFLSARTDDGFPVFGMNEGFFEVVKDPAGGDATLRGESASASRRETIAAIQRVISSVPMPTATK